MQNIKKGQDTCYYVLCYRRLGGSYVAATLGATGTALGLNNLVKVSSLYLIIFICSMYRVIALALRFSFI